MVGCDRCGASPPDYGREMEDSIRLVEMQPAFGVTALLCMECRKMWYRTIHTNQVFKKYQEAMFEMDFWRREHRKNGKGTLADGKAILASLTSLEEQGCAVLDGLIRAGLTRKEKEERRSRENEFSNRDSGDDDDDC